MAFTASYRSNDDVLVFVGAHHVFTPQNSTLRAVSAGFAQASPAIVIVEGFPTSMGANPPPLVDEANRYGTPQADEFAKGEAMYAASLALRHGVPFVGGEPTREEQLQALVRKGYTATDVYFAYLVGGLSQSIRSGAITGPADPRLTAAFASPAQWFARQLSLQPMTLADFSARYRAMFGVDVPSDADLTQRSEPGTSSPVALLNQADMFTRDQHLLATIEAQLALKKRVLVVYGAATGPPCPVLSRRSWGSQRSGRRFPKDPEAEIGSDAGVAQKSQGAASRGGTSGRWARPRAPWTSLAAPHPTGQGPVLGACVVMSRQRLCRYQQRLVVVTVGVAEPDLINGRRAVAEVGPVTLPKQAKRRRVRHVPAHAETGLIREAVYRFR